MIPSWVLSLGHIHSFSGHPQNGNCMRVWVREIHTIHALLCSISLSTFQYNSGKNVPYIWTSMVAMEDSTTLKEVFPKILHQANGTTVLLTINNEPITFISTDTCQLKRPLRPEPDKLVNFVKNLKNSELHIAVRVVAESKTQEENVLLKSRRMHFFFVCSCIALLPSPEDNRKFTSFLLTIQIVFPHIAPPVWLWLNRASSMQ